MANLIDHKGMKVLDSGSGDGGVAISNNFAAAVDWHPRSVWNKTSDPTSGDDGSEVSITNPAYPSKSYQVGSLWLNISTGNLYICVDNATGNAKWVRLPYLVSGTSTGVNNPKLSVNLDGNGKTISNCSFSGNGSALTTLNASNISSGTLSDGRLSANIPRLNQANTFSAAQTVASLDVVDYCTVNNFISVSGSYPEMRVNRADNSGYAHVKWQTGDYDQWSFQLAADFSSEDLLLYDYNASRFVFAFKSGTGDVGVDTEAPTAKLDINGDTVRLRSSRTPGSASASGNEGDICWDSTYVYVCVATDTWKRAALSTW